MLQFQDYNVTMEREVRVTKPKLHLTVDSPGNISFSMSRAEDGASQDEVQLPVPRNRRRTTSFKARRSCEQRRHSLPLFNKHNAKAKSTKKMNVFQRMGSRLAKVGDDLLKTRGRKLRKSTAPQRSGVSLDKNYPQQGKANDIEHYAAKLAELGDYLESLYSNDVSQSYSANRHATLSANCSLLTTILVALRNHNVVVIRESDLETLSASFCRIHRVKSISRKDR